MKSTPLLLFGIGLLSATCTAEVKDSSANGFTIATTFVAKGSPDEVYRKIVSVGESWSSEHSYSGDARNLTLDAKAGGCWCEKLPKVNGSVAHMQVATAWPGRLLLLTGGMGPLEQMGASGAMTFKLASAQEGTKVEFTYASSGYYPQGMNALAPTVDKVLMEAITRLRSYIQTGNPAPMK